MCFALLARLLLLSLLLPLASAQESTPRIQLPIEVLGDDGATLPITLTLSPAQREAATSLSLQIHNLRYPQQAIIQMNSSPWLPLTNDTVSVAEPAKSFGGIGGAFATISLTLQLPPDSLVSGANTFRFRFNHTDGLSSGYRVLALNLLSSAGTPLLDPSTFTDDSPNAWTPPHPDPLSIAAGKLLWNSAPLVASSLPNSPRIRATCADCHAEDGRDLKYFNFSNTSIISRSRFHGLSPLQGEQIASYIRSLPLPNPGRPWNPPYQPGPGLDDQPITNWSSGAGLAWVLPNDSDALPYLIDNRRNQIPATPPSAHAAPADLRALIPQITPDLFRPDGNLNPREIPVSLQLPDWSQWLPRIHPKDAWGTAFTNSELNAIYGSLPFTTRSSAASNQHSLRSLLWSAAHSNNADYVKVAPAFARWSQARRTFLAHYVKPKTDWSPELAEKVYSTQLWQLVKTWEITQQFSLESQGRALLGEAADSRTWANTIPADTAPSATHIPNSASGIGGSALTNEYLSASWYQLQIILNSGTHRRRDRSPVDWLYIISHFRDLSALSNHPEPVRLLVAITKSFQSSDPRLGPDDFAQGWRPDRNIDPRILVTPPWDSYFKPFPFEVRRTLVESVLSAWMDKTLEYPVAKYLPLPVVHNNYSSPYALADVSGGQVWQATPQFRATGVSDDLLARVQSWGQTYTDRAARLQYH